MPTRDWRTVGELLADSDALARKTLLDVSADQGPAMLRTWAPVVQSAARLWSVLPPASVVPATEPDLMVRLQGAGRGLGRSVSVNRWLGAGPADERLAQMAHNFSRAANLVERYGRDVQPTTSEVRADIAAARGRIMHPVYVAAHGTGVALAAYQKDLRDRVEAAARRHPPLSDRPNPREIDAAQVMITRLGVFEQLAGEYVAAHPVTLAALGEITDTPRATRLQLAMVASVDVAYLTREVAAMTQGFKAPARVIAPRTPREAEIEKVQRRTGPEDKTRAAPGRVAANQSIPLPESVRRGLVNLANDVIAAPNKAVAAAALLNVGGPVHRDKPGRERSARAADTRDAPRNNPNLGGPRR